MANSAFDRSKTSQLQDTSDPRATPVEVASLKEQRFHAAFDQATIGIAYAGLDGRWLEMNQRWCEILGLSKADLFQHTLHELIQTEGRDAHEAMQSLLVDHRQPYTLEQRHLRKDDAPVWISLRVSLAHTATGEPDFLLCMIDDITERKQTEEALRESKERLNIIARITNDALWDWDLVTNEVVWSEATSLLFGYQGDSVPRNGAWWIERIHPVDQARVYVGIKAAIAGHEQSWADEYRFRRADSSYAYVLDRGYIIRDQAGRPMRMIGAMTDFSQRREAEVLTNGQKRVLEMIALGTPLPTVLDTLARLIEAQSDDLICAILLLDESGEYLTYGAGPSLPEGYKRAADRIPIGPKMGSSGSAALLTEQLIITDIATDLRWAAFADLAVDYDVRACWSTPIMSSIGQVLGTFAIYYREPREPAPSDYQLIEIATHISGIAIERTRTAAALQNALQRLNFHVENTPLGMVEWNQNFRALRWSHGAERIFGWKAEEVLGKSPHEWHFVHVDDVEVVANAIARLLGGERRLVMFNRNYTKDGRVIDCVWYCSTLRDSADQPVSVLALVEDVTARLQTEESLRFLSEATALLASSLDYEKTLSTLAHLVVPRHADWCLIDMIDDDGSIAPLVVAHKDPGKIAWAKELHRHYPLNPNAEHGVARVLRTGKAELMSEIPDEALVRGARSEEHLKLLRAAGLTSYMSVPLIARQRTLGVLTFISAESGRRYGAADLAMAEHLACRAAIAVDNSRLYRESQEAIIARDEFLSIASHELKTPITSLQLQAQSLLHSVKKGALTLPSERFIKKLELINQQTERLTKLANDLLDVARIRVGRIELRLEAVDLAQIARDVTLRFEDQIEAAGCSLTLRAESGAVISADRIRLEQVVTNLLSNAIKYGGGKPIEVAVETDTATARLIVRDHGIGIAADHLERIFVRFERAVSSRHYGGLGLGLYIARQIVESLHGSIHVTSELGCGSTFVVILPLAHVKQAADLDLVATRNSSAEG